MGSRCGYCGVCLGLTYKRPCRLVVEMDDGIMLNTKEIQHAVNFMYKTPMTYTCRNVIHHHLFGNGILFSHRRGRIRPDPHMQEIMNDFWLPFCKNMLDSALTMGIAVIRIVQMEDGLRVPICLEPNACRIKLTHNLGLREYVAIDDQQQVIPDSIVLDIFGYSPSSHGGLRSVMSNLIPRIQYMNMIMGTALTMERKRSSPVIMTEAVDTKTDNVEGINYDYYADGDMQDASDANKFQRNRSNVAQLAHQQAMYDAFFSGGLSTPSTGSAVLDNVVTLPIGQKIVNMPQQTGRGDLVNIIKSHEDAICAVMGVPRSLFMSDTPHKSDAEGTHQTFQKTILSWKTSIQTACEQVYNTIYADAIKTQLMAAMGKKRKRKPDVADVYALKKRLQVEIVFPISPFIGIEQLHMHYARGVLPWDTYVEHACAAAGLPHQPMPEPQQKEPDTGGNGGDDGNDGGNDDTPVTNSKKKSKSKGASKSNDSDSDNE